MNYRKDMMGYNKTIFKSNALIFFIIIFTTSTLSAANLVWNPSSGNVDGYKIYYGTSSTNPTNMIDVGNTTEYTLDQLPLSENTQYYFCVTAYNTASESPPCASVAYTPSDSTPPLAPVGLTVK
jgi:hypothetical protein